MAKLSTERTNTMSCGLRDTLQLSSTARENFPAYLSLSVIWLCTSDAISLTLRAATPLWYFSQFFHVLVPDDGADNFLVQGIISALQVV